MSFFSIFRRCLTLLMSVILIMPASLGSVVGFTQGTPIRAKRQNYSFDNSRLLIGGYNMNHRQEKYVKYAKDADFDFFITGTDEPFLDLCDRYGIGVIAKNYKLPTFYYEVKNPSQWLTLMPGDIQNTHASVWGNDLIDEPTSAEFERLSEIVKTYYMSMPNKLPLINLFPIYANEEQLGNSADISVLNKVLFLNRDVTNPYVDKYRRHVSDYINKIDTDYISVDIYPLGIEANGEKSTRVLWLRNLDILAEACRATGRDLWVITQATGEAAKEGSYARPCDTADIRWQSYVTVAFGAKAIIHACYDGGWWDSSTHLINPAGERTETYYSVKQVNSELKAFAGVYGNYESKGAYLLNKRSCAGVLDDAYLTPVETKKPQLNSCDPLLVGCFDLKDGDGKAYTVVNMSEPQLDTDAAFTLNIPSGKTAVVYRKGAAESYPSGKLALTLESCEGVFITVS